MPEWSVFKHVDFDDHEKILFCTDSETGLKGIIALHSTALGPAAGGCRMYPYNTERDALTDVLRLSKGMSYKNSVAGLPLGGGKCVIIADPTSSSKNDLLRSFAKHIQSLNGLYWTAIDIGVGPEDADVMAESCDYIFARASQYEPGFDPSSFTALGGYVGIKAGAQVTLGTDVLTGLKVAVQGLGATGFDLCRHLHNAGAELVVTDVRQDVVDRVVSAFGAQAVHPDLIHATDVDVFAPCAMGAILNDQSIPQIKAKLICGLANNQLAASHHGAALMNRGIAYVPDYVVNAGGMMGASTVIFEEPSRAASLSRIHGLFDTIVSILMRAKTEGLASSQIADWMALERIAKGKQRS